MKIILYTLLAASAATSVSAQPTFSNAVELGTVDFGDLRQASGIAASRNNQAVLWTHNDSGDAARVFAIDAQGQHLGTYNLPNVSKTDFEDMAIGPGPVTNVLYLYVGDIGDNNSSRSDITLIQIPEPAVDPRQASRPPTITVKGLRAITLTYPDGAHNAETLLVDPSTGDVFIGTKQAGACRIYVARKQQIDTGVPATLSFVRELAFDLASGGSISPSGREIVIRQEDFARLWRRLPGQSVNEAFAQTPASIPVVGRPTEPNGEAIGFDPFGRGYFTLSDSATTQPLYFFGRGGPLTEKSPRVLLSAGSTWKFSDIGTNAGTAWRLPGFNDTVWKSGDGQFGYGDGDEQTTVGFGGNGSAKFITTYFRKTFTVTNAPGIAGLELKLLFDDGAAVYLNGTLVALANLANGAPFDALATATQEELEDTWFTYPVAASLLVEGENTLAVEVHQAAANSPDLSFDLQLLGFEAGRTEIVSASRGANGFFQLEIAGGASANVAVEASNDLKTFANVGRINLTNGTGTFVDPAASAPQRFYRIAQ